MSTALDLTFGDSVLWGSARWKVNAIDDEQVIMTNMTTRQLRGFPLETFNSAANDGKIKRIAQASSIQEASLTKSQKDEAEMLAELGEALYAMDRPFGRTGESDKLRYYNAQITARMILDNHGFKDKKTFSKTKLEKILKYYRNNGGDFTFYVNKSRKKQGSKLPEEVDVYIQWWIDNVYLTKNKPTVTSVYKRMRLKAPLEIQQQIPSESTIRRKINALDMGTIILKRDGKTAHTEYMRGIGKKIKTEHVMERVEMDAMHLILGVLDDEGRFLGYATIYFAVDFTSRATVGWHVEVKQKLRGESTSGVMNCFKSMLDTTMPAGLDYLHPIGGIGICVHLDQGVAYANKQVIALCKALKISIQYTGTKSGWGKPVAEAFVKAFRNYFGRDVEGYRHKDDIRKGDTEHAKHENCVYLSELKRAIRHFVYFEYNQTRHDGLKGEKPADVWDKVYPKLPPMLPDEMDTHLFMGEADSRRLHSVRGITLDKQTFQSKALKQMFCELDTKKNNSKSIPVDVRFNPEDASTIIVVNPQTGECLLVPNIDETTYGQSFIEANAQARANHQKRKEEQRKREENQEAMAIDMLSKSRVKKKPKNRPSDSVPLDDGSEPFTMDDIRKLLNSAKPECDSDIESDILGEDDSDWGVESCQ